LLRRFAALQISCWDIIWWGRNLEGILQRLRWQTNNQRLGNQMKVRSLLIACMMGIAAVGAAGVSRAGDVRMFVRHEVADYGVWRKSYDAFAPVQKKWGVIYEAVYQSTDDPNDVTVIHDFHSLEKAKAFAALPELKAAMEKGGVKGAPQIWYTTKSIK
jgi:hypothetical protein